MAESPLPRVAQNPITAIGVFLTTVSAVLFILSLVVELLWGHSNPYLGIVFFFALPGVFLFGLLLIPLGMARERRKRQRGLPPSQWRRPNIDLNKPKHRRILAVVSILTIVNVLIVGLAAYKGVEYMDSPSFCGQVCHTVMEPEHTAYLDGPHARVACVECHIGPGAPWFVKAKIDGIRQVWAVTFNTYSKPIPSPVHDLRPARDTCEHCHWPEKFSGDVSRVFRSYADDEANTEDATTMLLRIGGGGWRAGGPHGIHWHTSAQHRVEYVALDEGRETIPVVRLIEPDGKVTEFVKEGTDLAKVANAQPRTMDCVDCHNRPSHRFAPSAERAVDAALAVGLLPRDLPYVRREAVAALKVSYTDRDGAERGIGEQLKKFYAEQYPALSSANDKRIARAVAGAQRVDPHNVFPKMSLTWGTHSNHLGHMDSPGCFRCHDDEHKSKDGRTISQDCELCHKMTE